MKFSSAAICLCLLAWPAQADQSTDQMMKSLNDLTTAREVGQIIGTADICGYELDAAKVANFMSEKTTQMDGTARAAMQSGGGAHKIRIEGMSDIERVAACSLQATMAKQYGLTP